MSIRALLLGLFLVASGQGLYAEQHQGPDDFHMGPVPNVHDDDHGEHEEEHQEDHE